MHHLPPRYPPNASQPCMCAFAGPRHQQQQRFSPVSPPPPPSHLKDLLSDEKRCKALIKEQQGLYLDFSRQRLTLDTLTRLMALAEETNLKGKIAAMFGGEHINGTEDRAVLHVATRARRDQVRWGGPRCCLWVCGGWGKGWVGTTG